jgi:hypothetical protein
MRKADATTPPCGELPTESCSQVTVGRQWGLITVDAGIRGCNSVVLLKFVFGETQALCHGTGTYRIGSGVLSGQISASGSRAVYNRCKSMVCGE